MFEIKIDEDQLREARNAVFWLRDDDRRLSRGINRAIRETRQEIVEELSREINLPKVQIAGRVEAEYATRGSHRGKLTLSSKPIPVSLFKPVQRKDGVIYRPMRGGKVEFIPHAFGPEIPRFRGSAYKRQGKQRKPLIAVLGKSLAELASQSAALTRIRLLFTEKLAAAIRRESQKLQREQDRAYFNLNGPR